MSERREAFWTLDAKAAETVGNLYYFAPVTRAPSPYKTQRHVEAIIDIADDGTLAGVELIDNMPPPPLGSPMTNPNKDGVPEGGSSRKLSRNVTIEECPWLYRNYSAGEIVYIYSGVTYGCIGSYGVAVTDEPGRHPFFELPIAALVAAPPTNGVPEGAIEAAWAAYREKLPAYAESAPWVEEAMHDVLAAALAAALPFLVQPQAGIGVKWRDISTLSNADKLILAWCPSDDAFPDGRMMIWNASLLWGQFDRIARGIKQPSHLAFPATLWAELPVPNSDGPALSQHLPSPQGEGANAGAVPLSALPPADLLIEYPGGSLCALMFHFATEADDIVHIAMEAGFDLKSRSMDGDDDDLFAEWCRDEGEHTDELLRRWVPAPPEGYHLAGKWDTEDGPVAHFVRRFEPLQTKEPGNGE